MPTKINYPFATSSGGASLEFTGPINASQSLDTSGYYFSDNLTENIGIDCSGLGLGAYVNWVNLSTKAIVFYGLATVNGTTIPANKGVWVESNTSIEFFLRDASFNARVLSGSYVINWIPGQEPPYLTFNYSSPSALNGIINAIGTANGTVSYSNPYTSGKISCYPTSGQYSVVPTPAFDKAIGQDAWTTVSNSPPNNYWTITFNNNVTVRMKRLQNYVTGVGGDHFWNGVGNKLTIYGSNDGTNWVLVYEWTLSNESITNRCVSPVFANDPFYKHYKFQPNTSTFYLCWQEFECFGDITGL